MLLVVFLNILLAQLEKLKNKSKFPSLLQVPVRFSLQTKISFPTLPQTALISNMSAPSHITMITTFYVLSLFRELLLISRYSNTHFSIIINLLLSDICVYGAYETRMFFWKQETSYPWQCRQGRLVPWHYQPVTTSLLTTNSPVPIIIIICKIN